MQGKQKKSPGKTLFGVKLSLDLATNKNTGKW